MKSSILNDELSLWIQGVRKELNLGQVEFANLLGMSSTGERTVRGWESGEHKPTKSKVEKIKSLKNDLEVIKQNSPFYQEQGDFTFIDLFAGIGGIRLPFQNLGGKCVFTSEMDKFAQQTYLANFGEMPSGDITKISAKDIPSHDILLGGFPCQAFSQAGLKKGFEDTRGTMFFEIQKILAEHQPKAFMLENVKQLKGHEGGKTLDLMLKILRGEQQEISDEIELTDEARSALSTKLNYDVDFILLKAVDFGIPQHRERIFIVGIRKDLLPNGVTLKDVLSWPKPPKTPTRVGDILEDLSSLSPEQDKYTISDKLWFGHQERKIKNKAAGKGFGYGLFDKNSTHTNTISARYYKDGSEILIDQKELGKNPRKLTPRECANLQGFPKNFIVDAVSSNQIYKQFGNSVCVPVVQAVANSLIDALEKIKAI